MPGILSRDAFLYRRRSGSIASSTSNKSSGPSSWGGSSWGSPWNNETPYGIIDRGQPQLPFEGKSRRAPAGGNVVVNEIHPQPRYKESRDDQDSWGQFIDTAEAEDEMIRHSKILSKRYSMQ
jgi:hypothetical protein